MKTVKNYLESWTEPFREWLAWKIFPEFGIYMEAAKRMGELDENIRCVDKLTDINSSWSKKAAESIKIKLTSLDDLVKKFEQEGFDEPPF